MALYFFTEPYVTYSSYNGACLLHKVRTEWQFMSHMGELTDYETLRNKPSLFVEKIIGLDLEGFDYQQEFIDYDTRHRVIASGRQVGKSRMCAWLGLHQALCNPYTRVLITAPSMRQSSLLFSTLYNEIDQSGMSDKEWGIDRDTQTIIEFDNGSSIHCLPTGRNGNKIRGFTADMVIVDEAAFIEDSIFEDILEPMLYATQGRMVLASTPWGESGYFYRKFDLANSDSKWGRTQVSSYANPLIEEEDLEDSKQGKTESQIDREIRGKFVEDSAQFFPQDGIDSCLKGGDPSEQDDYRSLGVDIAGTGTDRTVFYGVDGSGEVFLYDEVYDDMGVLAAAEHIKSLDERYDFNQIKVDRTAIGQGTIEALAKDPELSRKHEPIYFTIQNKQEIYQRLKAAFEAGALHLPHDDTLLRELGSIGSNKTRAGNLQLFPRGSDSAKDDHVDALALAVWGLPEFGDGGQSSGASTITSVSNTNAVRQTQDSNNRNFNQRGHATNRRNPTRKRRDRRNNRLR